MPEIDRTSEDDVRAMMERLIPNEEERLACCEALAETITYVNQCKPSCWGVTAFTDGLRMNVSNKQVFVLGSGYGADKAHLTVDTSLLEPVRAELSAQGVTFKPWSADLPDAEQVTLPSAKSSILFPLLRGSLLGCVKVLAERVRTQTNLAKYHSPGVMAYLQSFLNRELPEPVYQEREDVRESSPDAAIKDWRVELRQWLSEGHSLTTPPDVRQLREDFVETFPQETLADITIEQYVTGKPGSFCNWLEFKTKRLGGIGGGSSKIKFGVYWSQKDNAYLKESRYPTPEEAFAQIRGGIVTLVAQAAAGDYVALDDPANVLYTKRNMRGKLLYLYFPDRFLPMFSKGHISHFLEVMGQVPADGDLITLNRQLWQSVFSQPEFSGFDGRQAMDFFYHKFTPDSSLSDSRSPLAPPLPPPPVPEAVPEVKRLLAMAERTRNILLYGPPGTGKTWLVTQFARAFTDPDKAQMVTFHQSFAYEEFVEGIRPVIVEGQVQYGVQAGVFKRICETAEKNPEQRYLLIIDEINRANIAKVLGELITLIEDDKRVGEANEIRVTLPYSGKPFGVPKNLTILGTMNTADRSIALLDLALRRRFTFVEMPPDPSLLKVVADVNLRALLERLNGRVAALLDRDHQIGHSYLMNLSDEGDLHFAWYGRVVPLLQEYFHGDGERLRAALGRDFVREVKPDADARAVLGGAYDEAVRYEVVRREGADFLAALRRLAGGVVTTEAGEELAEGEAGG